MNNRKINAILSSLKENSRKEEVDEMTGSYKGKNYKNSDAYNRGLDVIMRSIERYIDEIIEEVIKVSDREDFLEEDLAELVLTYIGDMIGDIPDNNRVIRDMASNLDDYLDRP